MPLSAQSIEQAAQLLLQARRENPVPIGDLPDAWTPTDVDQAMQIQDTLNRHLVAAGMGPIAGTKIGCTTQVMQEYLGVPHPCAGAIFASTVHHDQGQFDFDRFLHVGVECEIAARLGSPVLANRAPHSIESVSESIASIHAAIEIVDDRYVDFQRRIPSGLVWVADNFFGAGIVLGSANCNWQDLDLPKVAGAMRINGLSVGSGHGRDIIHGHPLEALVWLANDCARRGRDLPADWIVMLGSVVKTHWIAPGDVVEIELEGLGGATARF